MFFKIFFFEFSPSLEDLVNVKFLLMYIVLANFSLRIGRLTIERLKYIGVRDTLNILNGKSSRLVI